MLSLTHRALLSRQYDPAPSPNTTTGTASGTPVEPYTGPNIGTFLEPFGKYDLLAYMHKYVIALLLHMTQCIRKSTTETSLAAQFLTKHHKKDTGSPKAKQAPTFGATSSPSTPPATQPLTFPATARSTSSTRMWSISSRRLLLGTALCRRMSGSPQRALCRATPRPIRLATSRAY